MACRGHSCDAILGSLSRTEADSRPHHKSNNAAPKRQTKMRRTPKVLHPAPPATPLSQHRRALFRSAAGLCASGMLPNMSWASGPEAPAAVQAVILVYHRFAETVVDSMTVRKTTFAAHLQAIRDAGAHVITLADLVAYRLGRLASLPSRAVVLTADDGHRSVAEVMAPMMAGTHWPMTLFIYPSAISNAPYAMRWEDLKRLQATGQYDVQSHTYWHPNFIKERKAQSAADFERFATLQLRRSKTVLETRMGPPITRLAWPFGLYDDGMMSLAAAAGYEASFALGNQPCTVQSPMQALPRYLMVDDVSARRLRQILDNAFSSGA